MTCPKCGSDKVTVQLVSESHVEKQHHNVGWWIAIGWWWMPLKWIFFFGIALVAKILNRKKSYKTVYEHKSMCICQNCGHTWEADQQAQ